MVVLKMTPLQPKKCDIIHGFLNAKSERKDPAESLIRAIFFVVDDPEAHEWKCHKINGIPSIADSSYSSQSCLRGKVDFIRFANLNLYRINMRSWYKRVWEWQHLSKRAARGCWKLLLQETVFRLWPKSGYTVKAVSSGFRCLSQRCVRESVS